MSHRSTLRRTVGAVAVPALTGLLVAGVAAPAASADTYLSKRSGETASVFWTEQDPQDLLGAPGNVHQGSLEVEDSPSQSYLFGSIADYQCEPGEVPWGHGEEGEEGACELLGQRFLEADEFTLTVDARTRTARLEGVAAVSAGGHGAPGDVLGRPVLDITWKSERALASYSRTERWQDERYSYRSRISGRASTGPVSVRGSIGAMGFADDADDESSGEFRTFKEVRRERWTR